MSHSPRTRTWIKDAQSLSNFVTRAQSSSYVGLDVETTLRHPQTLCLVQIATAEETALIDALAIRNLSSLSALLSNPQVVKVIHNASFEQRILGGVGLTIDPVFDTLSASRARYRGQKLEGGHKLESVCLRELNFQLDKRAQASDWMCRPLTRWQLEYAALDAEVLLDLYHVFQ